MSGCDSCRCAPEAARDDAGFRRVLWIALAVNAAMFLAETGSSIASGSAALLADALDFFADAATYAITLFALALGPAPRARAALVKGLSLGAMGLWVAAVIAYKIATGVPPEPMIMGPVAVLAFAANASVAVMLYRHRMGDANRESVWLCSRNDAIGNLAVLLAASGVFVTGGWWPDVLVAGAMAALSLTAAVRIVRRSLAELGQARAAVAAAAG
ncbi:MAG: cation transporter [Rhodospirillales bacterium]